MLSIIILNYNGWKDTIECLESLRRQTYTDFHVIVEDNGSSDNSVAHISEWAEQEGIGNNWLKVLPFKENYGFAKGNNRAIEATKDIPTDYYLCLNNDTEMEAECLQRLIYYMDTHPEISAVTPGIRLYDQPELMWNAGGKLVFGGRRYYCPMQPVECLKGEKIIDITFITGCALMVRKELINNTQLFTERFFFGEEDFDFSLRMKKAGKKMVCLTDAILYHKVSASQKNVVSYNKLFIYLLNRTIDLRLHYSYITWIVWLMMYIPMISIRFMHGLSIRARINFIKLLLQEGFKQEGVSKELFEYYSHYNFKHVK